MQGKIIKAGVSLCTSPHARAPVSKPVCPVGIAMFVGWRWPTMVVPWRCSMIPPTSHMPVAPSPTTDCDRPCTAPASSLVSNGVALHNQWSCKFHPFASIGAYCPRGFESSINLRLPRSLLKILESTCTCASVKISRYPVTTQNVEKMQVHEISDNPEQVLHWAIGKGGGGGCLIVKRKPE